jgi:hypothetical protein
MPRTCSICHRPDREKIERALIAGESYRHIAAQFGLSTSALVRHRQAHLLPGLVKAREFEDIVRADSVLDDIRTWQDRGECLFEELKDVMDRAQEAGDWKTVLLAIRSYTILMNVNRRYLELRGELSGELRKGGRGPQEDIMEQYLRFLSPPR